MTEVTSPEAGIQPMSLPARIAGVVMSPRQTYAAVAKEAWDLHKAVLGSGEVRIGRAGF